MNTNEQIRIYTGRLCPMHLGHELIIRKIINEFSERCLLILGSSNATFSLRNFFNYAERRSFIKAIFPELDIVGLPDYATDDEWLLAMDDIICTTLGIKHSEVKDRVIFMGGCDEDVDFFHKDGRRVEIINRFDGTTPKISATEVRDALIHGRDLDGLLNPAIQEGVISLFQTKWEKFKKI